MANSAMSGAETSSEFDEAFSALLGLPDGLLDARTVVDLTDARRRLAEGQCNLVVLGEFNRGKSTLVNALLRCDLLPTGVLPLTSVVTMVRAGDRDRLVVRFQDGREEVYSPSDIARYATEAENPENRLGVEMTIVETPTPLLNTGIRLIDTPGVGSVYLHNTEAAQAIVPRTDAALIVLSADQPLSAQEQELLAAIDRIAGRVVIVLNRIDLVHASERERALAFVEKAVLSKHGEAPTVIPVSARDGIGLDALREWIGELQRLETGAWAASGAAARIAVARAATSARTAAQLELAALDLPAARLEERAAQFATHVEALIPAREAAAAALLRGVGELLRERVDEPLRQLAGRTTPTLRAELVVQAERHEARSGREFRRELARWVDDRVRELIEGTGSQVERDVTAGLENLVARYAAHIGDVLSRLADGVEAAFGERPAWSLPAVDAGDRPPLGYKLRDEEEALGAAISAARTLLPGGVGRRVVRREQEARLEQMIDRHAGRLRVQIAEQTLTAAQTYETHLADAVDHAAAAVRAHIDRARVEVESGAAAITARREQLVEGIAACNRIAELLPPDVTGKEGRTFAGGAPVLRHAADAGAVDR